MINSQSNFLPLYAELLKVFLLSLIGTESPSRPYWLADVTGSQGDRGPCEDGSGGGADRCRGSVGERSALLGQQGEAENQPDYSADVNWQPTS